MVGIVERAEGDQLQGELKAGQRLVSMEGDLWRWDGFIARADAPTSAARRLAQKNDLEQLKNGLERLQLEATKAETSAQKAEAKRQQLQDSHQDSENPPCRRAPRT